MHTNHLPRSSDLALLGGSPVRTDAWPSWPVHDEAEERALLAVLHSGAWWRHAHGQGVAFQEGQDTRSAVAAFERAFARARGCSFGTCVANGTVSLEIALRAGGVSPGDEVIVPPYTFIATASAPLMVGAVPIFADIDATTYTLDPSSVAAAITDRTRAIIPVHFGGQPCDMDSLRRLAAQHDLLVVEDAAHAHGSSYRSTPCGALGDMASFSFQNSKPMASGEGGIITTNDDALAEQCESLMWAGRRRGQPWYCHYQLASNARITEFQGAILMAQLQRLSAQVAMRTSAAAELDRLLECIPGIVPLSVRAETTSHTYHVYIFRYDADHFSHLPKARFVEALQAEGIDCLGGYIWPLYANPMFMEKRFMGGPHPLVEGVYGGPLDYADFTTRCPASEQAIREAVWISQSVLMGGPSAMTDVAEAIEKIRGGAEELLPAISA